MPTEFIVYGVVFLSIFFLFEGVYLVLFGRNVRGNSKVNRRLQMMDGGLSKKDTLDKLRKELDMHERAKDIPVYSILAAQMQRAGIAYHPRQMMMIIGAAFALSFIGLGMFTDSSAMFRLIVSIAASFGGVYFWVAKKAKARSDLMQEQLPDAIELMVRSLRVGHPFVSAFKTAADETADPLGTEFGIVSDEIAYGRDMGEALNEMAARLDMPDLRFLAVAVAIQQQSGGNLAEVLAGLAKVIRERFKLFRKVNAITAEAKWSGKFLSGFPIAALLGVNLMDPQYFNPVIEKWWFYYAVGVMAAFIIANLFVMSRLTNIKV